MVRTPGSIQGEIRTLKISLLRPHLEIQRRRGTHTFKYCGTNRATARNDRNYRQRQRGDFNYCPKKCDESHKTLGVYKNILGDDTR